tara:strand:+ start:21 stop:206 length:186 start_codon:yes stop_codon:yes gene_type:complete
MKTTKTGLHIDVKDKRIEVYTKRELKELNELIAQNKKQNFNFAVAFFITIVFIAGYILGSI